MKGFLAVYLREILILKTRLGKVLLSFSINPLLYLFAFGIGLGRGIEVQGVSYLEFLVPGLISATTMLQAFAINVELNVARFYLKVFEEFQSAPISIFGYALGEVFFGITRAFLSAFIILLISYFSGIKLNLAPEFFLFLFLNAFIFASLGLASAMLIKSHGDQTLLTNFIITPMMFLGGTFFPVEKAPSLIRPILEILPLTIVSKNVRSIALFGNYDIMSLLILLGLALLSFSLAYIAVKRAKD